MRDKVKKRRKSLSRCPNHNYLLTMIHSSTTSLMYGGSIATIKTEWRSCDFVSKPQFISINCIALYKSCLVCAYSHIQFYYYFAIRLPCLGVPYLACKNPLFISKGWNNLSGTLPHELSYLNESLVELNLGGGSISGPIPSSFQKMLS